MGKLIHLLTASTLAFAALAHGQSAESLKPGGLAPGKTSAELSAQYASTAPVSENPSRYAGADPSKYVESLSFVFSIRSRNSDPFGLVQNPNAKPPKQKISHFTAAKYVPEAATPFLDIIRAIRVTAVMPGEKRFLVADRSIASGNRFPINYHGKSVRVQVIDVTSATIQFRNLDTGEAATLNLDVLPPGMSKGNSSIMAPGMHPNSPDAPLEIDLQTGPHSSPPAP